MRGGAAGDWSQARTGRHPEGPKSSLEDLWGHPVAQVSAKDGEAFCRFYGMRLPSEDEWEYAARGAEGFRYPWGNSLSRESLAAYINAGRFDCCAASAVDGFSRTAPVGSFALGRSPFGLDDMAGNVWEWKSSPFPGAANKRVIRGSGWGNTPNPEDSIPPRQPAAYRSRHGWLPMRRTMSAGNLTRRDMDPRRKSSRDSL